MQELLLRSSLHWLCGNLFRGAWRRLLSLLGPLDKDGVWTIFFSRFSDRFIWAVPWDYYGSSSPHWLFMFIGSNYTFTLQLTVQLPQIIRCEWLERHLSCFTFPRNIYTTFALPSTRNKVKRRLDNQKTYYQTFSDAPCILIQKYLKIISAARLAICFFTSKISLAERIENLFIKSWFPLCPTVIDETGKRKGSSELVLILTDWKVADRFFV